MSLALGQDAGFAVELPFGARAVFTDRAAGNLSLAAGEGHEHGLDARHRLCRRLGLSWLCAGPQAHGTSVRRVRSREGGGGSPVSEPADGHATALSGVGMMVLAADCLPVILCAPGAVAAVHAGWRGLAAGVLEEGVRALRELSGTEGVRRAPIHAVIGPCAGPCCYEVGPEVLGAFCAAGEAAGEATGKAAGEATGKPTGKAAGEATGKAAGPARAMLDMRAIARERLLAAGVAQVEGVEVCTVCDRRMFSHRREGAAAGRQAGIVWLS